MASLDALNEENEWTINWKAPKIAEFVPDPTKLLLEGECTGSDRSELDEFYKTAPKGCVLVARYTTNGATDTHHFIGPLCGDHYKFDGTFYGGKGTSPSDSLVKFSSGKIDEVYWFAPHLTAPPAPVKSILKYNPHYSTDELDLLPQNELTAVRGSGRSLFTLSTLTCTLSTLEKALEDHCTKVPSASQTLKCVVIKSFGKESVEKKKRKKDTSKKIGEETKDYESDRLLHSLKKMFSRGPAEAGKLTAVEGCSCHTLVLCHATTTTVCAVVEAQLPGLARLVLEDSPSVRLGEVLSLVADNKHLEEVQIRSRCDQIGEALMWAQKCPHISFAIQKDLTQPPKKVSARLTRSVPKIQPPISLAEFKEKHEAGNKTLGLLTSYGQVVPLAKTAVSRFQLLHDMGAQSSEELLVPVEIEPPVSKNALAHAVHFATHHVSKAMQEECEAAEALGREDRKFEPLSWCQEFDQFRNVHIQSEHYPTSKSRLQLLCELMSVATFLNAPALKRFVRAAVLMEVLD